MFSLASIESAGGTLHVQVSLHGRKPLSYDIPAKDVISELTSFEKALSIRTANRFDAVQHNKVRSNLVMLVEDAIDGKAGDVARLLPRLAAQGTLWCLVNHYRDAEGTRRTIHRFLADKGIACIDLVTTANDQMAMTVSENPVGARIAQAVSATTHGTSIGIVVDEDRDAVVTAYDVPTAH